MKCRFCQSELVNKFIDLVNSPPSNSFLIENELNEPEIFFPLKLFICNKCFLVQIDEYKRSDEIFNEEYIYYSSFSKSWLEHSRKYVDMITERVKLNKNSFVIEIASNDGYLLNFFKKYGIPCLGIEPSSGTAKVAREKKIEVIEEYFGEKLAKKLVKDNRIPDLLLGNNVLAHVPNINDFVSGLKILLHKKGTITMEFPHIMKLVKNNQFDTIYHEHFSYFSFITVKKIFETHGLELYDVEELETHGGSLRIYAKHKNDNTKEISESVNSLIKKEILNKVNNLEFYARFQDKANFIKYNLLKFLINAKQENKSVIAYGAAAKGNTLLNYCGIKKDLIEYAVDLSPFKQGKFLPGSHIPIYKEDKIRESKPNFIIILPWNIKEEIMKQLDYTKEWKCKFVIPIPKLIII